MLQPSQLTKKKFKMIAQMVPIICSGSEKITKLPLKLPKRTLSTPVQYRCIQEHVFTHCDRALHCQWFEHLEGVGEPVFARREQHQNIESHQPITISSASLSLLYNLLRLKSTHIWVDYLSSDCHQKIDSGWQLKQPGTVVPGHLERRWDKRQAGSTTSSSAAPRSIQVSGSA